MISVEAALAAVLEQARGYGDETISLSQAVGRVLAEPLIADRDFPPFDRVAMDGVAFRTRDFQAGRRRFPVRGVQAAGSPPLTLSEEGTCLEVMTGAVLPIGADCVVRYEDLEREGGEAVIRLEAVQPWQNVHRRATDRRQGEMLCPSGVRVGPAEVGVAATVGKHRLRVRRLPRVALISTGDELVEVHERPQPHQIRRSNMPQLAALLRPWGVLAESFHLPDDPAHMRAALAEVLEGFDVLVFSGAVSKGKFDHLPEVLEALGVERLFHRVAQRPGKPFWFGVANGGGQPVFAFPGNPVSTFVCCLRYFLPWLEKSLGAHPRPYPQARLAADFEFRPALTYFLQVQLQFEGGCWLARPLPGGGSGDLANLLQTDGFLQLPAQRTHFAAGEVFPLLPFRF
ncbi:MAG: molybdopterin molybdenumtransferase MoeA [Bacteroidetes bacterium]|nr:MAG: molybdopterin molybdenumtransferase MoeA [Bacteroidota bacterium]